MQKLTRLQGNARPAGSVRKTAGVGAMGRTVEYDVLCRKARGSN